MGNRWDTTNGKQRGWLAGTLSGVNTNEFSTHKQTQDRLERERRIANERIVAELRRGRTASTGNGTPTQPPAPPSSSGTTNHQPVPAGVVLLWRKSTTDGGTGGQGGSDPA